MSGCPNTSDGIDPATGREAAYLAARIEAIRAGRRPRVRRAGVAVGSDLPEYYRRSISGPARRMERLIEAWEREVPADLVKLTALGGLSRSGVLTVRVSSSGAGYQLRRLVASGLDRRLNSQGSGINVRSIRIVTDPSLDPESRSD